ncbi:hypothetical protein AGMMS49982_03180 [Bacteroidia bacterium]|nr:hypothetical protein AGMMS49982_03180 [Bacteroidia bacterium]
MVVIRAENSQYEIDHTLGSLLMVDDTQARRNKQLIRAEYDSLPPAFLDNAKDKTIDIIPWDIALLWAYDLNWTPRPVIQSYSAYTPMLDSINAQHFKDSKAPDNIIYSYKSIPGRYPLFDEPMVFRTLLENYDVQTVDDYLILQHRLEKITRHYTPVNQGVCPVGTVVDVPQLPGQHIYCNIDIRQNFFGKLINILYKPGYIYIRFFVKGQSEPIEYRFIRRLGTDGLFVSKYVADLTDICSVFEESYEQDIEKLQIVIPHNLFYKPDMKYEFYATPIL